MSQHVKIRLTGLRVWAHHGVFDFEKAYGQEFVIDAVVSIDNADFQDGDLDRTVNYAGLANALIADAKQNPVDLLETLANRLVRVALNYGDGKLVRKAKITVHKPNAPMDLPFDDVSVTVKGVRD